MPVRELLRGLAGAFAAGLATLILLLCLAETRVQFGAPVWGVAWMTLKGRTARFDPVLWPLLHYGVFNAVLGYVLATRINTLRSGLFALAGALALIVVGSMLDSPLPRLYGQAGVNTCWLLALFAVFLGAVSGALASERAWLWPKKRPSRYLEGQDLPLCRPDPPAAKPPDA